MSLKDLSKEQKQYVALGLLAGAVLMILTVLGVRFSLATVSTAKEELDDLTSKISHANQALSRSRQTSEEYVETVAMLKEYLTNAPPERNYYSWATEIIYSTARFAGLEIDSIDEITLPQRKRSGSEDGATISFDSYALRIMAHGGYENTKYFMNLLKQDYPLVRFSGVEISAGQNRDAHDVQLFMQWPFNFGEISKNWDAVASKKMKVSPISEVDPVAALEESEPVHEPAVPVASVATPDPVREPHPPTTRPEVEEATVTIPMAASTAPKMQPGREAESQVAPSSGDTAPKPATDAELQTVLSEEAPQGTEMPGAEPQPVIAVSEPVLEPEPVLEMEPIAADPEPIMGSAIVSDPDPTLMIEEEMLLLNSAFETLDSASSSEEPQADAMPAAPLIDASSTLEVDSAPEPLIGPQPVYTVEEPRNDRPTEKNEEDLEDLLNKMSAEEDASLSALQDDLVGEINEK